MLRQLFKRTYSSAKPQDFLQQLYLSEIRSYKPLKTTTKVDLPESFSLPTAPAAPAFDTKPITTASADAPVKDDVWPALVDPIDDPENYNDEWHFSTDKDDGSWYPKRAKEPHYHD
jgi:hypothetical protein